MAKSVFQKKEQTKEEFITEYLWKRLREIHQEGTSHNQIKSLVYANLEICLDAVLQAENGKIMQAWEANQ